MYRRQLNCLRMADHYRYFVYFCLAVVIFGSVAEKVVFLNMEHPRVTYFNTSFLKYANLTATRFGRKNPIYYVGLNFENIVNFDRTILIDVVFFELLTNVYKRSFIEFHYNWCHLAETDMFFGSALRKAGLQNKPCPLGPGVINLNNMTINPAYIPRGFPFTKGRIAANFSQAKTNYRVAEGYINIKLSEIEKKAGKFGFD